MLGYRAEEFVGIQSPALLPVSEEMEARSAELEREYGGNIRGFRVFVHRPELEGAKTCEWTYVRKDGSVFPVQISLGAMVLGDERITVGIMIDISEQCAQHEAPKAAIGTAGSGGRCAAGDLVLDSG